jgi:VCBS repeat-containing protein
MTTTNDTGQLKRRTVLRALGAAGAMGAVVGGTTGSVAAQESCCGSTTLITDEAYILIGAFNPASGQVARAEPFSSPFGLVPDPDPSNCANQVQFDAYSLTLPGSGPCVFDGPSAFVGVRPSVSIPAGAILAFDDVEEACGSIATSSGLDQVSVSLCSPNNPPTAVDDSYSTDEDTTLIVTADLGVLDNDSDPDGDTLIANLVSGTGNGTLNLNSDGSFTYTPAPNFNGTDSFEYEADDGNGGRDTAIVTLTVVPVNDSPAASPDSYSTPEDTVLNVPAPGVLSNDFDVDGDMLMASLVSGASNGTVLLDSDGSFTYTPAPNFNGMDSFVYESDDGDSAVTATVEITVTPVNDAPVAVDDAYSTDQATELNVSAPGVLANDSDPEGDGLTASLVSGPSNGTLLLQAGGSFSYTPNAGFVGTDSFVYKASDGNGGADEATVTITVVATGPFLRLPTGMDCQDIDQWTLQIQGNGPIDLGNTICGQSCDEYKVTLKPPKGGPSHKTELCGSDLNNLSGQKYEIEACTACSTPNYASVTLRPIGNKSTK